MDHANAVLESQGPHEVKNPNTHHLESIRNNLLMTTSISDRVFVKKFTFLELRMEHLKQASTVTHPQRVTEAVIWQQDGDVLLLRAHSHHQQTS